MRFEHQVFWLSKDAGYPDEYQDAYAWDAERGIAAIADGVGSTIFSGPWARLLTAAVANEPPDPDDSAGFRAWLAQSRKNWHDQIDHARLTWRDRPRMALGAMTTLLWIDLTPLPAEELEEGHEDAPAYRLRCLAIGDCCLFHLRDRQLIRSFPLTNSSEFNLDPEVLRSIDSKADEAIVFHQMDDVCLAGDLLVLCSDAVALWAMKRYEAGEAVDWEAYWEMPEEAWREEIFAQRAANAMRFDDSTLLLLRPVVETFAPPDLAGERQDECAVTGNDQPPAVDTGETLSESSTVLGTELDEAAHRACAEVVEEAILVESSPPADEPEPESELPQAALAEPEIDCDPRCETR